jgi:maltose phosphorylase
MNQDYITPDQWSIIEDGFEIDRVQSSESLFSIGNGSIGQRANFEETYTGPSFQGSYIGGVYYPLKLELAGGKTDIQSISLKCLMRPTG